MMNILLPYPFVCNKIITNNGTKQKWKQKNQQIMKFFSSFYPFAMKWMLKNTFIGYKSFNHNFF